MLYIICINDTDKHAFDDIVVTFHDDEWEQAQRELRRLNKNGRDYVLRDH